MTREKTVLLNIVVRKVMLFDNRYVWPQSSVVLVASQWNYRDLSAPYPDTPHMSRPVCNSHYTRQVCVLLFFREGFEGRQNDVMRTVDNVGSPTGDDGNAV